MKNKKYIICSGLAFADQEDMEMLHQYALDGWIFKEFKGICYVLYKEEPQDLIFSYDMQKVKKEEQEDYLRIFEEAGWEMIPCKDNTLHFFCAKNGTVALHSNSETRSEQFKTVFYVSLIFTLIGIILFIGSIKMMLPNVFAGIGGGCMGGGGVLLAGSYLRLQHKRWIFYLTFTQAVKVLVVGALLILISEIMPDAWSVFRKLSTLIGICFTIFGGMYALTTYRIYRDGKESRGKKR